MTTDLNIIKNERGLTLVEIVVVLIILGLVFTMLVGGISFQGDKARRDANRLRMQQLKQAILEYQLRYNALPPTIESLVSGSASIGGNFVAVAREEDIKDSWGNTYAYTLNGRSFTLKSYGKDGAEGGEDANADDTLTGP